MSILLILLPLISYILINLLGRYLSIKTIKTYAILVMVTNCILAYATVLSSINTVTTTNIGMLTNSSLLKIV